MSARVAPIRVRLDADRWHFQYGPIDLVIGADGDADAVTASHEAAWQRFQHLLDELVAELPQLRLAVDPAAGAAARAPARDEARDDAAGAAASAGASPVAGAGAPADHAAACPLRGSVAQWMWQACRPFAAGAFITPMAAVAGAVADELISAYRRAGVRRAWVNNGGDIALHLTPGQSLRVGLLFGAGDPARPLRFETARAAPAVPGAAARQPTGRRAGAGRGDRLATDGRCVVHAAMPVRGVATSGWRGRSFSLGIADSVTVLARTAAEADAAATVIANAVDVDDARIVRRLACDIKDDSDLGAIPVTVDVPPLGAAAVQAALQAGLRQAQALRALGLIAHAVLACQGAVVATADGRSDGHAAIGGGADTPTALPAAAQTHRPVADRRRDLPQNPPVGSVFA